MKKFDIITPIGVLLGVSMLSLAVISQSGSVGLLFFIQLSSIAIVLGGVAAALLINFSFEELKLIPKALRHTFVQTQHQPKEIIETIVGLATQARKEGLLSLEKKIEDVPNPFIKKGVLLAVDGLEPDDVRSLLENEIAAMEERHRKGQLIFQKAGDYAPAWGMIGTLIGLVLMLQNLDDPATLGPNMAIALLTTLYGTVFANLIFLPMVSKLENKTDDEIFIKKLIIEGVLGIQSGQNPRIIEDKLASHLLSTPSGKGEDYA